MDMVILYLTFEKTKYEEASFFRTELMCDLNDKLQSRVTPKIDNSNVWTICVEFNCKGIGGGLEQDLEKFM